MNDLQKLGLKFRAFPELPETAALYQMQYYFIEHEYPAAHFAYAYVLEGLAAKKIELVYKSLEETYSRDACTFLYVHMTEDRDHFEDGLGVLNGLTQGEAESFMRNLQQTTALYIHILEHIKKLAH